MLQQIILLLCSRLFKILTGNNSVNRKYFYDKVVAAGKYPGLNYGMTAQEEKIENIWIIEWQVKTDAMGNPIPGFSYNTEGELTGNFIDNGGGDNNYIPPIIPEDVTTEEEDQTVPRNLGGLAPRFAGSIFDFTGLADGGRAGAMDGGRMMMMANEEEDDPTGGIMDLESGRQMYFLGKLVKKATRAVKKVAKSPIGKAALLYFGGKALMGGMKGSSFFGKGPGIFKMFGANNTMPGFENLSTKMGGFRKFGLTKGWMMPTISGGILAASALPLLMGQKKKKITMMIIIKQIV